MVFLGARVFPTHLRHNQPVCCRCVSAILRSDGSQWCTAIWSFQMCGTGSIQFFAECNDRPLLNSSPFPNLNLYCSTFRVLCTFSTRSPLQLQAFAPRPHTYNRENLSPVRRFCEFLFCRNYSVSTGRRARVPVLRVSRAAICTDLFFARTFLDSLFQSHDFRTG